MAREEEGKGDDDSFQGKKPHFFKVFLPGLTSEKLEIPPAFRKHMEPGLRFCFLMGPSGNIWGVALAKCPTTGSLFFAEGWKRFAEDHAMETGEFFVFVYHGAARFRLLIFDTSACEKESAFRAAPSKSSQRQMSTTAGAEDEKVKSEQVDGTAGGGTSGGAAAASTGLTTSDPGNKLYWSFRCATSTQKEDAGDGDDPEGGTTPPPAARALKRTYSRKRGDELITCPRLHDSISPFLARGFFESQRRPVTSEEIERAHQAANAFTSENPFQVIIMRKTAVYLGHSMPLPHSFARSYLAKDPRKIILSDGRGKEWEVNYLPLGTTYIFSAGWRQFSLDNNLEQDDACVFEIIGKDKIRVHIFRIVEEVKPLIRKIERP